MLSSILLNNMILYLLNETINIFFPGNMLTLMIVVLMHTHSFSRDLLTNINNDKNISSSVTRNFEAKDSEFQEKKS